MTTPLAQERLFAAPAVASEDVSNATVFTPNMKLPIHRWFRYSAGFSAAWVDQEVRRRGDPADVRVFDPFAGSGTTMIASQAAGAESIGLESHPFVARVARAKMNWMAPADELELRAADVLARCQPVEWQEPPALMAKIYPVETLALLRGLMVAVGSQDTGDEVDELLWLALVAILRACSPVGTAQWQYVLPNKTKAKSAEPRHAFAMQIARMVEDMRDLPRTDVAATLLEADARTAEGVPDGWANLVITSPPYPNNFDYADATRLEMTFLGEIESWGDLQGKVRTHLVRSCSQHMVRYDAEPILASDDVAPIADELREVYDGLTEARKHHGGKKAYNAMVVAYFADLSRTWQALRRVCAEGGEALFVIGDSAPYGVYVPVDRWLGELAVAAGFEEFEFTKLRDRNIKWKNRKHRVPLHEGVLHVRG